MGFPAFPSMTATWFTGRIGKSTSIHVFGRFGSLKSTVSNATTFPAPPASLEKILEVPRLLLRGVGEVATRRVPVVGGNDEPPARREAANERPKVVARQLLGRVRREPFEALASVGEGVRLRVGPVVPE